MYYKNKSDIATAIVYLFIDTIQLHILILSFFYYWSLLTNS